MKRRHLKTRLTAVLRKALEEQAGKNLPLVYRDPSCATKGQFIHLYPNGRKVLIQQNRKNSTERIIREL